MVQAGAWTTLSSYPGISLKSLRRRPSMEKLHSWSLHRSRPTVSIAARHCSGPGSDSDRWRHPQARPSEAKSKSGEIAKKHRQTRGKASPTGKKHGHA